MKTSAVVGLVLVCAASANWIMADDGAKREGAEKGATVEVLGLKVERAAPDTQKSRMLESLGQRRRQLATQLTLWLNDPSLHIIRLDESASRIKEFTDDRGTNLTKPAGLEEPPFIYDSAGVTYEAFVFNFAIPDGGTVPRIEQAIPASDDKAPQGGSQGKEDEVGGEGDTVIEDELSLQRAPAGLVAKRRWAALYGWISKDAHGCQLQVSALGRPAAGATKVRLQADFVFKCGRGEKVFEQKDVALKKGSEISAGPLELTIDAVYDTSDQAHFALEPIDESDLISEAIAQRKQAQQEFKKALDERKIELLMSVQGEPAATQVNLDRLKSVRFIDSQGNEIERRVRPDSFTIYPGNCASFGLPSKMDRATIKLVYYDKVETATVPADVTVGLGL